MVASVASSQEDSKDRSNRGRRNKKMVGGERPGAKANKEAMEEV